MILSLDIEFFPNFTLLGKLCSCQPGVCWIFISKYLHKTVHFYPSSKPLKSDGPPHNGLQYTILFNPLVPRVAQKQHNFGRSLLCKFASILNVFFTHVMIKDYILQNQVENCQMGWPWMPGGSFSGQIDQISGCCLEATFKHLYQWGWLWTVLLLYFHQIVIKSSLYCEKIPS